MSSKHSAATHFYFEPRQLDGDTCLFSREESDHILKSYRLYIGDRIAATDGCGRLYQMKLTAFENRLVRAQVISSAERINELPVAITIAFGLPQQTKADQIIDQCTQLGAAAFAPLLAKNSPGKLTGEKAQARLERWRKVAISSMKQSLRTVLPEINAPRDLADLAGTIGSYDAALVGSLKGRPLGSEMLPSAAKKILLLTGPEEGFSRIEEDTLIRAGAMPVLLGERRLRAELAPVALLSAIVYSL